MTRRRLSREEIELWQKVVEQAERLNRDRGAAEGAAPPPKPARPPSARAAAAPPAPPTRIDPFRLGQHARGGGPGHDLKPTLAEDLAAAGLAMDRKAYRRMRRGKLAPEARIDLHGMRLDRAHPALTRFILASQASGRRLVLVITGKGKRGADQGPIPTPRGVLKHQVPQWLRMPPLAQAVLQITPAHVSHGGEGAYYVYLRRAR